ncbi:MAG: deoxyribose-phosphate aldolase [Clostridia bacterium]|jgi:deoxyribose-phosphate aldolase|nr:deoxyribose-phosphate aldolase [Clostridia bacterium]
MGYTNQELAQRIDHTLLKPEATAEMIIKLCAEARQYGFKAVCVQPCYVELCGQELAGSGVLTATVIGFPLGANLIETKVFEAEKAFAQGAAEVDMVMNIGALKDKNTEYLLREIGSVTVVSRKFPGTAFKVIIETALLTDEEKVLACELVVKAGADYVKTSTGLGGGGATVQDIRLLAAALKGRAKIKASGGIRTRETAEELLQAGADRLGASSGVAIVTKKAE